MLAIPPTVTTAEYSSSGAAVFPSVDGGGTEYVSGFIIVSGNPALMSICYGEGQWSPDVGVSATIIPISVDRTPAPGSKGRFVHGVRFKDLNAAAHATVFGALFQPGEPIFIPSAQFSGTIASPSTVSIPRVSALPSSPTDVQLVILDLNTSFPGTEWLCVYNVSTTYWDVLVGSPIRAYVASSDGIPNGGLGSFSALANPCQFTLPNLGDYNFASEAWMDFAIGGGTTNMQIFSGAAAVGDTHNFSIGATRQPDLLPTQRLNGLVAGSVMSMRFSTNTANNFSGFRSLYGWPIRIK